ncbi:MATE family efflux transporter [Oleiagrimonas sp. C23AA]|uniref:MATE family efflux transporter n=1 Tax=Oleiagrimonas sp. C23AA TaxID=2719047 RepID=UPI001424748E|nr:MATE family efflux transporter [Oleiagrimonas sp. C23AA]NII11316.1 MATE family efflux transporter [Oleiagrimonas sp. C23AA]
MPSSSHSQRLTEGPIARTLALFALPILGSSVLQSLNASVNAIWIGHYLGEAALTASSNANLVLFFLLGVMFGIGMANTILVGQAIGARNADHTRRVVGTSLGFFAVLSVVMMGAGFWLTPHILAAMGTPTDAQPLAVAYLRIIFIALPSMYVYSFLGMTLRGTGDSRTPFLFMLLSVALDIGLNPLLIFGVGPLPKLGIAGSATATLIAQNTALLALIIHLYRRKHFLCLHRGQWHYLKPDPAILRALVGKGLPMGLQMVVISSSALVMISLVNAYGSQVTAAYGAASQLWTYIQMPALAIGGAVSSMAAQNVGAQRWDRVGRITAIGLGYNVLLTGALVAVVYLFNRGALGVFLPGDGQAIAIAQHLNAIVVWSFLFFGASFVLFGVVRATGAVVPPLIILAIALWLVRVPFALALNDTLGADAIWWSFPLGSLVSLLLAVAYYRFGRWRQARMGDMGAPRAQAPTTGAGAPAISAAAE